MTTYVATRVPVSDGARYAVATPDGELRVPSEELALDLARAYWRAGRAATIRPLGLVVQKFTWWRA